MPGEPRRSDRQNRLQVAAGVAPGTAASAAPMSAPADPPTPVCGANVPSVRHVDKKAKAVRLVDCLHRGVDTIRVRVLTR